LRASALFSGGPRHLPSGGLALRINTADLKLKSALPATLETWTANRTFLSRLFGVSQIKIQKSQIKNPDFMSSPSRE
jgi:hypothetical protein